MTDNSYKIELGIGLNTTDFNSLKTKIKSLEDDKIKIKLDIGDADNKIDGIKKSLQDLGKGNTKNTLTINTASLENSLADVKDAILDIRNAFGTLDDKSNMKSLLSSINQIANSIGKVTDETDTLIKSLSVLSKKDFGFNFNLKTGNANPLKAATDYGIEARRKTIPALREQAAYLENLLGGYQQADKALERHLVKTHKASGVSIKHSLTDDMANTGSIAKQMEAIEKYIGYLKEIAIGKGIKLDGFDSQFSQSAEKIVDDTVKIQTGVKQTEEALEAAGKELKQVFGGGIGAEQLSAELTPIINKLGEIRDEIQNLSKGTSLDGLTQSFDRLSDTLKELMTNAKSVQDVLNTGFSGGTQQVNRKLNNTVGQSAQKSINVDDVIDQQTLRLMEEYGVKGKNAFNEIRQAIINYRKELVVANNVDFDPDDEFAGFGNANINQIISAITKQKKEVNELKEAYKGLTAYVKEANDSAKKNGTKIYLPDSIRQEYSDDFRSMRSQLGAAFTSDKKYKYSGIDFEGWITELNGRLGGIIDLSKGAEYAFEDLVKKNNFGKGSNYISGDDLFEQRHLSFNEMEKNIESSLDIINQAEMEAAQVSTQTTNTIIQNNERQQQSHKEVELAKKLAEKKQELESADRDIADYEKRIQDIGLDSTLDIETATKMWQDYSVKLESAIDNKDGILKDIQQIEAALQREAQQSQETANVIVQSEERKEQARKQAADAYKDVSNKEASDMGQFDDDTVDAKELNAELTKLKNLAHQIGQLDFKIVKSKYKDETSQVREFERQLELLKIQYNETVNSINAKGIDINSEDITREFANARSKIAEFEAKIEDTKRNLAEDIKLRIDTDITKNISKVNSDFNNLSIKSTELKQKLDLLDDIKIDLDAAKANNDIEGLIAANERYERVLKDIQTQLDINKRAQRDANKKNILEQDRTNLSLKMDNWLKDNSAAAKKFGATIRELQARLKSCDSVQLDGIKREFEEVKQKAKAAGKTTQTFGDAIKTQFSKYSAYFGVAELFMYAEQGLRDMFEQVKLIDSAMTELKKVTDETDASYNKFLTNAATRAREIGTTIDGLVSSTADFARLGYGFEDAQGLAEVANIYAVVGDEINGVEGATESLISTMAAFKGEMNGMSDTDFAMSIIDKFNEIGNNFAISSGGIGEAMERSASSLMAANNTIDESIALITAANTVVQDPAAVGTAFKTISMRIRGAKTELEEAGLETEGMVDSTAKLRQEILALSGVDIMENANEFKSTYKIMDELAAKWEDLTDIQQASVTELIAGKRQGNIVSSLMTNFDTARDALETSLNSSGSAMKEHEKWQQSLEAQILKLKAAWQGLSQAFLSSDFLHGALDAVIGLVDGLTKLIDTFGTLPTLLGTVAAGFSLFKNKGLFTFDKDAKSIQLLGTRLTGLKGKYTQIHSAIDRYNSLSSKSASFQEKYNKAMAGSSTSMGKYLSGLKGAKASFGGYIASLIGARIKTIALEAATIALNTALTMGLSFAIQLVVEGIMKLVNADKELAESVEEITSKFKEQHDELAKLKSDYDTTSESSMISKYEKLSKGVDGLGRNVSLTADEYSEYQSIVNQIAEQIPTLVSGYDEQGNALLSCKGNVEQLTEAYQKLIHAQNQEILTNTGKIEKDFANTLEKSSGEHWWSNGHGFWTGFVGKGGILYRLLNMDLKDDTVESLEKLLDGSGKYNKDEIFNQLKSDRYSEGEIRTALENANIDIGYFDDPFEVLEETLETDPQKVKNIIGNYYEQFAQAVEEQKTIATAKLSEAFDISSAISGLNYGNIGEELQAVAYQTVNSFDYDFLSKLSESGKSVEQWVTEMLTQLNSISKADNAEIEAAFDLQTQFNGGEISYGEYVRNLKDVQTTIDGLNLKGKAKEQLEISLGLNDEGIVDQYESLVKRLTDPKNYDFDVSEDQARKLLDGLSSEELSIAVGVITDMSNNDYHETAEEIKTAIERELSIQGLSLDLTIEKVKLNAEALTTAITESFSGSGLSEESMSAVEGIFGDLSSYDSSKLFERTANGIRLNRTELSKLNDERKNTDTAKINKEMDSLGDIYNQTREELYHLSYGTDEYNAKLNDLNDIERQINDLEKLAAGVEGVTSAFQEWQMVESAGSERDMYETVLGGIETMADEIDRGWIDDGTIELLELLTGRTDLATMSAKELKKVYKGLDTDIKHTTHSVRDFFTVDEEGNSTSKGVFNFLDAIGQMEEEMFGGKDVVKRDKNNKIIGFDFQIVGGNEVIAEALGISEELVEIMVRAADDAGFVVSMDGTYQQLDVLREKAQEASVSLNKVLEKNGKKGFDFNFNTSDVDDITKQLIEAKKILDTFRNSDGIINTKLEGADEALTVASTLQSMLDKLSRPTYMKLETNQVEDDLQEPLKNLQELQTLTETEHQLKLSGADTSKLDESKQEIYKYFEELDPEVKAELGLVDKNGNPLTGDALKEKLNSGEITIDATVDIQMEMDEKLGILVDKALLDAGIIDGEEFNKRVKVYLEADVDNEDAKEKTDNAVKEVAEGKGGKSSSKDGKSTGKSTGDKVEKKVDVDVKADEVDTSSVKDKTKETVEKEAEEKLAVETTVELETTIEEATELIQKFEDKDILIDVKVKGLEDVKELSQNIDLATKIDGNIDNLSEYVEGAKALSKLDENISSFVTAEVKGNVIDEFEYKLDNLKVFAESAKGLEDIGYVESNVKANVNGNVIDKFEYKLNNLKVFTDSAKDIDKIGNVESNVKATVNTGESGDVVDTFEYKLDNLGEFAEQAKKLQGLDNVDISVDATVNTGKDGDVVDTFEYKLDNLSKFAENVKDLQGLDNVDISVKTTVNTGDDGDVVDEFEYKLDNLGEFASHVKDLQGLQSVDVEVKATVNTGEDGDVVDTFEYKLDNLGEFATHVKELQGLESVNISVTAEVNTGDDGDVVDTFEYKLNNLQTFAESAKALQGVEDVSVTVSAKVNTGNDGDAIDEFEYKLNNLETFAKGARELQGLENVDVSVNAKVNTGDSGDAVDTFEYKLNNLEVFAKAVKELQGLEDVNLSVKAKINGGGDDDVTDTFEYKLDNLGEFAKHVKLLQGLENVDISVKATVSGDVIETAEYKLDNLGEFKKHAAALQNVESKKISITANIYGNVPEKTEGYLDDLQVFAEGAKALQNTASKTVEITANIYGNVPTYNEGYLDDLQVFAKGANALQSTASKTVNIEANVSGNAITGKGASGRISRLTEFKSLANGMSNKTVTVSVKASVDSENVNKAIQLLKDVSASGVFKNYNATVQVGAKIATIDDTVVKNYQAPPKDGKVKYSVDSESSVFTWTAPPKDGVVNYSAKVDALTDAQKNKTGTITYKAKISGFPVVNGTANANGTTGKAFSHGDWGVKKTETALTGELGQELVVYGNRFWTVGDNGAEFTTIPKGAIVFNHKQTEEIFKNGRVTSGGGRGKAYAFGTAYPNGSTGSGGDGYDGKSSSKADSKSKKKSSSKTEDKFEEVIDWIETILDRAERAIDKYEQQANNIYKSWSSRNKALENQIDAVGNSVDLYEQAKNKYLSEANKVGLDEKYAKKVRDGSMNIEDFEGEGDEKLVEKIKEYQNWYEKYLDAKEAAETGREEISKLYAQRIEHAAAQFEGTLGVIEHEKNMLEEYISQAEAQGHLVSGNYYKALISNEKDNIAQLTQQRAAMLVALQDGEKDGTIPKYTQGWYQAVADIDAVTEAIEAGKTSILEYTRSIEEVKWEQFDILQDRIGAVTEEADFLIELMSSDKLHDDNGQLTDEGKSTMGLHGQNYNTYMYQADLTAKEIKRLEKELAKDPYDEELRAKYQERISQQQEYILSAQQEKEAIRDLVSEGIELELDALNELIDKKNEALQSEKDLYEYNKRVKEQTSEIASLQKQMAAYSQDNSEEAKAKVQELRVSLEEAEDELKETEWDKYIQDTEQILTNLYDEYELVLNERLDNLNYLIESMITQINTDATTIGNTISEKATEVGYTLSDEMKNIWHSEDLVGANGSSVTSILSYYGNQLTDSDSVISKTLDGIKLSVDNMIKALDKEADAKAKDAGSSSAANPPKSNSSNNSNNNKNNNNSDNNNKSKVTNDTLMGIAAAIWCLSDKGGWADDPYRKNKLTEKLGATNAKKVQQYINQYGSNGKLYDYYQKNKSKFNSYKYSAFKSGVKDVDLSQLAWTQENGQEFIVRPSDGAILTPIAKGDSVLTSAASNNIWDMANSPAEFIKNNLNLGAANVPNNSTTQNLTQHFENINFHMPNVHSYNELITEMQRDPKFEKLVLAMTIDRLAGKSSLAKGKSIR